MINKNLLQNKFVIISIGLIYTYLFYLSYILVLNTVYGYMGFEIIESRLDNVNVTLCTFLFSVTPLIFYNGIKQISSFLAIFIYYILYVPIIVSYFFELSGSSGYLLYQQLLFMIGMSIIFLSDHINFKGRFIINSKINISHMLFIVTILIITYIIIIYHDNLRFVSIEDVYVQRSSNKDFGQRNIFGYIYIWLSNALIPFLLSYGLFAKKYKYFLLGILACLIVFMATAAKSVLTYPLLILLIYLFIRGRSLKHTFAFIGLGLSLLLLIIINSDVNLLTSLFLMRTIGNGGSLTRHYHDFFLSHPHTYYSHVNVVNLFTNSYPFKDLSIGQVVGREYYSYDMNANANFWATDGIASLGDMGIIISSVILFLVFVVFNNLSKSYNKLFLIMILIPYLFSLLNTSLFSSVISGGAFIIFLLLSTKHINQKASLKEHN